jgi:DNA-binding CsgD family transcriptional regulator
MQAMLTQLIGAIGERDFVARTGDALRRCYAFDLAAIFLHRGASQPRLLFENFAAAGGRLGIDNYVRSTHRLNPLLLRGPDEGIVRARDFAGMRGTAGRHIVAAPEEELGFRTIGWPERLEEVALHFPAWGGRIELGLYRERGRRTDSEVSGLGEMLPAIRAAFLRHDSLSGSGPADLDGLTAREREICQLLLAGCSSEAIALRLDMSRYTVKDHRKSIYRKLGIATLAELFGRFAHCSSPPPGRDGATDPRGAIDGHQVAWRN